MYALYKIVKTYTTEDLEVVVNQMLELLWEPIGAPSFDIHHMVYMQAMGVPEGYHAAHLHRLQTQRAKPNDPDYYGPGMASGSW